MELKKEATAKHRLKVEKKINRKAMLLNLSFNYFFIYVGVAVASLSILISGITGPKVFSLICINTVAYIGLQYLDQTNFFDNVHFKKLPKSIDNDLYKLKHGKHKLIKKPTYSKSTK